MQQQDTRELIKQNAELLKRLQIVLSEKKATSALIEELSKELANLDSKQAKLFLEETELKRQIQEIQDIFQRPNESEKL